MKFASFFMSEYAHMIMASAMIATLFFGGWQVPFVSTQMLQSHAADILYWGLIGFGVFSLLLGLKLVSKFRKGKYGDKRDYEVLVFGIPAILVALLAAFLLTRFDAALLQSVSPWIAAAIQVVMFVTKILFFCWIFIWVRWTVPRFRYDQLMNLGWKYMLPIAMGNVVVYAVAMVFFP
jgi:NADH-quinone oxidoreductase subunit H